MDEQSKSKPRKEPKEDEEPYKAGGSLIQCAMNGHNVKAIDLSNHTVDLQEDRESHQYTS
jgi:DNA-binding protein YbaB